MRKRNCSFAPRDVPFPYVPSAPIRTTVITPRQDENFLQHLQSLLFTEESWMDPSQVPHFELTPSLIDQLRSHPFNPLQSDDDTPFWRVIHTAGLLTPEDDREFERYFDFLEVGQLAYLAFFYWYWSSIIYHRMLTSPRLQNIFSKQIPVKGIVHRIMEQGGREFAEYILFDTFETRHWQAILGSHGEKIGTPRPNFFWEPLFESLKPYHRQSRLHRLLLLLEDFSHWNSSATVRKVNQLKSSNPDIL